MNAPRLMIAAPSGGTGKSVVSCALLAAMQERGLRPTAYWCGPDGVNPMLRRELLGVPARNLDLFLTPEQTACALLCDGAGDYSVLEGAGGFYDGVGDSDEGSSYRLARATRTPVVFVLNPAGMSLSAAALVGGYLTMRADSGIAAVLLNRCTESDYHRVAPILEQETGLPVAGYLPELPDLPPLLGPVSQQEAVGLRAQMAELGRRLECTVDVGMLLELARSAPSLDVPSAEAPDGPPVRIAVARDEAFCFYYEENLDLLLQMGAQVRFFSPLRDTVLPDADGLMLGGGFPQAYARRLSQNEAMRVQIWRAVTGGMPTVAQGAGYLYLHRAFEGADGTLYPMAGVFDSKASPDASAQAGERMGPVTLTAQEDNLLCPAQAEIRATMVREWESGVRRDKFRAQRPDGLCWDCVTANETLFAGFTALYLPANVSFARRFLDAAARFREKKQ